MTGYRVTLDIAKGALSAAQNNMAVTGHNISNVSTEGYSRQTASLAVSDPMTIGAIQFGRGVTIESVQRQANDLLTERLRDQLSLFAADEQASVYADNLETLFDIQSENELGSMISEFWNTWHDLSNNPAGVSERTVVYEYGTQLCERFNNLNEDLLQLEDHISQEIDTGVGQINDILDKIASLNVEINLQESLGKTANDQRDSRENLVTRLAQMMSINTVEQSNGFLTILTDGGYPMVIEAESYHLRAEGGRVIWPTSSGGSIDISDDINSGKISGWLDIKEDEVAKMKRQLDTISKELIWQVNLVHSQGVGLKYQTSEVNGTYGPITSEGGALSTLTYGHKIDYSKDFKMWTTDSSNPPNTTSIEVDMAISDTSITYTGGAAGSAQTKYYFTVTSAGTVDATGTFIPEITWQTQDYSTDPPGPLVAGGTTTIAGLGPNNLTVDGMNFTVDTGYLVAGNTFTINTDGGGTVTPLNITNDPSLQANSVLDNYIFRVVSGGGDPTAVSTANPMVIEWRNSHEIQTFTLDDPTELTVEVDGMELTFNSGYLFNDDVFSISTDEKGFQLDESGTFSIETSSQWHWTVESFKDQFNTQSVAANANVTAYTNTDGSLKFVPNYGYGFAFSDDQAEDSGLMAALGINTYFEGDDSSSIKVNSELEFVDYIAAARIDGGESNGMIGDSPISVPVAIVAGVNDTFRIEENDTSVTITLTADNYTSTADLHRLAHDIQEQMNASTTLGPPSPPGPGVYKVVYDENIDQLVISENDGSELDNLEIFWAENGATATSLGFKALNKVYEPPIGDYGINNNANALALTEVQYTDFKIAKWNFSRGEGNTSDSVTTHIEGSYQDMLAGIGVKGASLRQSLEFGDIVIEQLTAQRDSIAGVSIDEEMVKLIAYQQSYTAASKLIRTVDEMLQSLMAVK